MINRYRISLMLALVLATAPNLGCSGESPDVGADAARVQSLLQERADAMTGEARPIVTKGDAGHSPHLVNARAAALGFRPILDELRTAVGHGCDVDVTLDLPDESGNRMAVKTRVVLGEDAREGEDAPSLRVEENRSEVILLLVAGGAGARGHDGASVDILIGTEEANGLRAGGSAAKGEEIGSAQQAVTNGKPATVDAGCIPAIAAAGPGGSGLSGGPGAAGQDGGNGGHAHASCNGATGAGAALAVGGKGGSGGAGGPPAFKGGPGGNGGKGGDGGIADAVIGCPQGWAEADGGKGGNGGVGHRNGGQGGAGGKGGGAGAGGTPGTVVHAYQGADGVTGLSNQ